MFRRANSFALLIVAVLVAACDSALPITPDPSPSASDSTAADSTGNHRPSAVILGTTLTAEGVDANFSAMLSSDLDSDALTYWWDFGDGAKGPGALQERHLYVDNGDYRVRLIVTDPHGAADTATQAVNIYNVQPRLDSLSFSIASSPAAIPVHATVTFHVSDLGAEDHPVAVVDWGDGTVSEQKTHTYATAGVFSISIKATDKDGGVDSTRNDEPVWAYSPNQNPGTAPGYDAIDLGTLGGKKTVATALNNRGDVVGYATPPAGDNPYSGLELPHAFVWRNGVLTDLNPRAGVASMAQGINDGGVIGGALWDEFNNNVAMWRNGSLQSSMSTGGEESRADVVAMTASGEAALTVAGHEYPKAYLWDGGALVSLGGLGSPQYNQYTWVTDRNTRGQIVGASAVRFLGTQRDEDHAFVWENGVMRDLGTLAKYTCESMDTDVPQSCGFSWALGINDQGQIVGTSRTADQIDRAVMWDAGSSAPRDLAFGNGRSRAVAINNQGQIAGDSYGNSDAYFRGSDGSTTVLGSLGGGHTQVVAMNNAGVVVGLSTTAAGEIHGFVWQLGLGMRDLGAGIFGAPGVGSVPVAVNDRGDIIGTATPCRDSWNGMCRPGRTTRAVLWRTQNPSGTASR